MNKNAKYIFRWRLSRFHLRRMSALLSAAAGGVALTACTPGADLASAQRATGPAIAGSTTVVSSSAPTRQPLAPSAAPAVQDGGKGRGLGQYIVKAEPTRVLDPAEAERLLSAKGVSLQWIDWDRRGSVFARMEGDVLRLSAAQSDAAGKGTLRLDGTVLEIGQGYFTFKGVIQISNTPDMGRNCRANKTWHFAVTQNRPYWRLREFEWCDGLTDYVDIYF
jgi:hypothetical protein